MRKGSYTGSSLPSVVCEPAVACDISPANNCTHNNCDSHRLRVYALLVQSTCLYTPLILKNTFSSCPSSGLHFCSKLHFVL